MQFFLIKCTSQCLINGCDSHWERLMANQILQGISTENCDAVRNSVDSLVLLLYCDVRIEGRRNTSRNLKLKTFHFRLYRNFTRLEVNVNLWTTLNNNLTYLNMYKLLHVQQTLLKMKRYMNALSEFCLLFLLMCSRTHFTFISNGCCSLTSPLICFKYSFMHSRNYMEMLLQY